MAREIGGVVGFVVGNAIAPGLGGAIGMTIGSAIGGYLDPIKIPGPALGEAPIQTSRDGVPIPIAWGTCHCHGNVIIKNPEYQVTTTERQGKGGSSEVETTRRYRTFAIGVARSAIGPIASVSRIWENDKLVYDSRDTPAISAAETAKYAENIRIYLGGEDQLPDPDLETHWGVGDTPAFRGLAYIVWVNYDLTDFGGAIPQYRFEINAHEDASLTSKPYPIEAIAGVAPTVTPERSRLLSTPTDGIAPSITPQDGLIDVLITSHTLPAEGIAAAIVPQSGTLSVKIQAYATPAEGIDAAITPQDGTLSERLVQYDYPAEGILPTITPQNGTLT